MKKIGGFTLIELLIVIAIIAILTVAFLPGALRAPARARDGGRQKAVHDIQGAVEAYIAGHGGTIPPMSSTTHCFDSGVPASGGVAPVAPPGAFGACGANQYWYISGAWGDTGSNTTRVRYAIAAAVELRPSANYGYGTNGLGGLNGQNTFISSWPGDGSFELSMATARAQGGANDSVYPPDISGKAYYFVLIGPQ